MTDKEDLTVGVESVCAKYAHGEHIKYFDELKRSEIIYRFDNDYDTKGIMQCTTQ